MKIRKVLSLQIIEMKEENKWTYEEMMDKFNVHRSQLINIIKHEGKSTSIELMERVINEGCWRIECGFYPTYSDDEDRED